MQQRVALPAQPRPKQNRYMATGYIRLIIPPHKAAWGEVPSLSQKKKGEKKFRPFGGEWHHPSKSPSLKAEEYGAGNRRVYDSL